MINLLLGAPGGGKSYEAVAYHVLPALSQGRKVITNLPLQLDEIYALEPSYAGLIELRHETRAPRRNDGKYQNRAAFSHAEDYGDDWRHPETGAGPLYVIDECHIPLPVQGTPIEVEHWYSLHRHESADVLLITQSYGKINRAIRDLVQVVYRVRKATALGTSTSYIRKVQDGLRGAVVNEAVRSYKPAYFKLYKSHTRGGGAELAAGDIRPIWHHWSFKGAAVLLLGGLGYLIFGDWALFPEPKQPEPRPTVQHQVQAPPTVVAAPVRTHEPDRVTTAAPPATAPVASSKRAPFDGLGMHVTGYIQMGDRIRYGLAFSQNGQVVRQTTDEELRTAGYGVEPVGECLFRATYEGNAMWVRCDAPMATVTPFGGVTTARPTAAQTDGGDPARGGDPAGKAAGGTVKEVTS